MKKVINSLLGVFGVRLIRTSSLNDLLNKDDGCPDLEFIKAMKPENRSRCIDNLEHSTAQLRQDLFVLNELDFKTDGFFVEFGATDGIELSNSLLLESRFGWSGILAEPARTWHEKLHKNRTAQIDTRCVWSKSGETLTFNETEKQYLSTIDSFSDSDFHGKRREGGTRYEVETVSLTDLLVEHNAPGMIDFLSIDTEGSEFDILAGLDFDRFKFRVIACEHNHTPMRQKVFELLTAVGYERRLEDISLFDDWYVLSE